MRASQRGSRVPRRRPPTIQYHITSRPVPGAAVGGTVGDPEKSTCTHADVAGFGGCRAERGAHEEKAEVDGRSGVRVGLARALSAHRVTKDRSRAIFLKFVDVVTAASLRRCQL